MHEAPPYEVTVTISLADIKSLLKKLSGKSSTALLFQEVAGVSYIIFRIVISMMIVR